MAADFPENKDPRCLAHIEDELAVFRTFQVVDWVASWEGEVSQECVATVGIGEVIDFESSCVIHVHVIRVFGVGDGARVGNTRQGRCLFEGAIDEIIGSRGQGGL